MIDKIAIATALMLLAFSWWLFQAAPEIKPIPIPCKNIVQGCGYNQLIIRFDQIPQVMQPFRLQVNVEKNMTVKAVYASFNMRGMDMGLNRYRLTPASNDTWRAKVTLPICSQARGNWLMTLEITTPNGVEHYQLAFNSLSPTNQQ